MKHKYILLLIVSSVLFFSCDSFLDQAPTSEEDKEYIFEDYIRAQRYLDLLYYYMPARWTGDGKFGDYYGFLESATDMSEYSAASGATNRGFNVGNWRHASVASEVTTKWSASYKQIRRCWVTLENLDKFNNHPEGRKEIMTGEAYFFLAFYYNELLFRYGGVPIVTKALTLEDDLKIPRASYEETLDFIIENIDKAYELLPWKWTGDDVGRVSRAWCLALKSRVLLYAASPLNNPTNDKAKWQAAAEASRELIDYCKSSGHHQLSTDWQNIFMRGYANQKNEIIVYKTTGNPTITFNSKLINGQQATPGTEFWGSGCNTPTQNFVDRFEVIKFDEEGNAVGTEKFDWNNPVHVANIYKNRDPRFYYTVLYNGRFWIKREIGVWRDGTNYGPDIDPKNQNFSRTGYYLRKFWPRSCFDKQNEGGAFLSSFYIRLGEIYLNYAEAMNEAFGPYTDGLNKDEQFTAVDAINELRARLICPENSAIGGESDPFWYVKEEREENPDFPVLANGMPPYPTNLSQADARERIRNERVVELCFEDHYFYDILRWKEGSKYIGGTIYGVDVVKTGETYTYTKKEVEQRQFDESRMYKYPIPKDDVFSLGIEQNPGW